MQLFTDLKEVKTLNGLAFALKSTHEEWVFYCKTSPSSWIILSTDNRYHIEISVDPLNSAYNRITAFDRVGERTIRNENRIKNTGLKKLQDYMLNIEFKVS